MKRKILLFSLTSGIAALTLSSYGSGPSIGGAGNRTGAASSLADCSTGGCHSANTAATTVSIALTTQADAPVTTYTPGTTYKVKITGSNTSNLPRFGFQATCVQAASPGTQAGSFTSTAGNISVRTTPSPDLVEHNTPIAGSSGSYTATFNWTAPSAGTGTVRFYAILNAVNNNGATSGDMPNTAAPLNINEAPGTGIAQTKPSLLAVYPNPATDRLNLSMDGVGAAEIRIWDLSGRLAMSRQAPVSHGSVQLDISHLVSGNYLVLATRDGLQQAATFVKK